METLGNKSAGYRNGWPISSMHKKSTRNSEWGERNPCCFDGASGDLYSQLKKPTSLAPFLENTNLGAGGRTVISNFKYFYFNA